MFWIILERVLRLRNKCFCCFISRNFYFGQHYSSSSFQFYFYWILDKAKMLPNIPGYNCVIPENNKVRIHFWQKANWFFFSYMNSQLIVWWIVLPLGIHILWRRDRREKMIIFLMHIEKEFNKIAILLAHTKKILPLFYL